MNRLLIIAILIRRRPRLFGQMGILGKQVDEALQQEEDTTKLEDLAQRIVEGEKELGPEYLALVDALRNFDFDSKDGQEILSRRFGRCAIRAGNEGGC